MPHIPSPRRFPALASLIPLLLVVAGCGGDPASAPAESPCAAMLGECLKSQQICVESGGAPQCEACAEGHYAASSGACEALDGARLSNEFADFTVKGGEEVLGLCQSWTLNNATELWVNAVELEQNAMSHHSNWLFVPSNLFEGPDGVWPCKERNYTQLTAALQGGVLYAQSTQAPREVQKFASGAAVRIPPYARIIGDVHLLNTSSASVTGHAKLNLYTLPESEVKVKLVPFHLDFRGLAIPPLASSRFYGECEIASDYVVASGDAFDIKVHYLLPHTHEMASRFFAEILGGPSDGRSLVELIGFNGEAHGTRFEPPVDMTGSEGFRFGCDYENNRSESVGWGFGDQEMCELLGFAEANAGFESRVKTSEPAGTEGDRQLFTGKCDTLAFEWDHNKPGGSPPSP